jgi:hypothetical protein
MNGCKAKILNMVWTAAFIQQHIPISPALGAIVKIIDHGLGKMKPDGPWLKMSFSYCVK